MQWPRQAWPYLVLIVCIVALKMVWAITSWQDHWVVQGAQVTWKPLSSPGLALVLVLIGLGFHTRHTQRQTALDVSMPAALVARAKRPLLTIFFFLAMSQMMVKAGFLAGLMQMLAGLSPAAATSLVALFGALSGYMTGSNVGGNAIFMPAIAMLPESSRLLLAAVQNSSAGHAALGSLSVVMLILGLAKTQAKEEGELVRFGFTLVCLNTALVALGAVLLEWMVWIAGYLQMSTSSALFPVPFFHVSFPIVSDLTILRLHPKRIRHDVSAFKLIVPVPFQQPEPGRCQLFGPGGKDLRNGA